MKRISCYSLVLGLGLLVMGCQSTPKQTQEYDFEEERMTLQEITPEVEAAYNPMDDPSYYQAGAGQRTHVVQKGDTLFSLARLYYNDQSAWRKIYQANQQQVPNPDSLKIGQKLVIP